jgi:uncharacterized protein YbjT (DUF2867 family)
VASELFIAVPPFISTPILVQLHTHHYQINMKVIVLGSTGFIGKEVLDQCLKNPAITSLIAFSRRDLLEAAASPKLTVVIIENFKLYPDSILEQLKDADACI